MLVLSSTRRLIQLVYLQLLLHGIVTAPTVLGLPQVLDVILRIRDSITQIFTVIGGASDPCYDRKYTQPPAQSCEDVILPNGFCNKCGVGTAVRSDGDYKNCLYTSDVELLNGTINMQCLDMMDEFVALNPCDTQRAAGLREYRNLLWLPDILRRLRTKSRQTLDSFVYAICESACDCIPQYNTTLEHRAMDFHRGNCQGHILFDVCQVYPNIKVIRGPSSNTTNATTSDLSTIQPVCPYIEDWRTKHPGAWFNLTPTPVDPVSHDFLVTLMNATEIMSSPSDKLWRTCVELESAQHRIILAPSL